MAEEKTATEQLAITRKAEIEKANEWIQTLSNFDWKNIPPHQMAMILTKKPYRGKAGEPDYYLSLSQALVFAMRSYELGLSPLSSEVWFDKDRWTTNVTLEGKIKLARERGITGAPEFTEVKRPWKAGSPKLFGYTEEPGVAAAIDTGKGKVNYTVWLSEWYVAKSPVWQSKPEHMMRVRAYDKVLAFAAGVGVSDMPSENELGSEAVSEISAINASDVKPQRMPYADKGWAGKPAPGYGQVVPSQADNLEPVLTESIRQVQEKK